SACRSASMPVRALISAVFPWSMCPAVPTMMDFIEDSIVGSLLQSGFAIGVVARHRPRPSHRQELATFNLSCCATIEFQSSYELVSHPRSYSGAHPRARPHIRRIRKDQTTAGRARSHADRARHLQRNVE